MRKQLPLLVALAVAILLFVALAVFVHTPAAATFNAVKYAVVARVIRPGLTPVMVAVSTVGEWCLSLLLAVVVLLVARARARARAHVRVVHWAVVVGSILIGNALVLVLKSAFALPRPTAHRLIAESGYGFPSGHSITAFVLAGSLVWLCFTLTERRWLRALACALGMFWVILVGFSRVYLGVHFTTDIIGGWLAGAATLCAVLLFVRSSAGERFLTTLQGILRG
ncbi:MAG: phosphatase PAP2 family protein [Actinomycetia bacterium]|nr:phosphatase PAP2 family protein [Actinomycetes bacterium]